MPQAIPTDRQLAHKSAPIPREKTASRGYGGRWQRARAHYLKRHPLCVRCMERGDVRAASVVDHVTPHRGNQGLMWNVANWQALCKQCHDSKTAREDR